MELDINSAIKKGFFQQVRFLVRFGHGVNKRDADGRTPLINCAFVDDERWAVGLARTLIESGARVGLTDRAGVTALHYACMLGRSALVQVFLKALDFDLNQPDRYGNTALHSAVSRDHSFVVMLLLESAAKYGLATDTENQFGVTPLSQAIESQHDRCVHLLRQAGNMKDSASDTTSSGSLTDRGTSTDSMSNGHDVQVSPVSSGRPQSRPLLVRRERSQTSGKRTENGYFVEMTSSNFPLDADNPDRLIRAASPLNLRNNPEFMLQMSPRRCFAGQHTYAQQFSSSFKGNTEDGGSESWRRQLKKLYATYGYQFSSSYRKGVPPIDRTLYVEDAYGIARPISPDPSDIQSELILAFSKRTSRRGSVMSGKFDLTRGRRNSILSMRSGRTSTTFDSSGSDSSSYTCNPNRKSASSDDLTSTSDKPKMHSKRDRAKSSRSRKSHSSADKRHGDELPSRPLSRTGHHSKDVSSRVGHHALDAVTNMNAVAEQLGAIKEYQE